MGITAVKADRSGSSGLPGRSSGCVSSWAVRRLGPRRTSTRCSRAVKRESAAGAASIGGDDQLGAVGTRGAAAVDAEARPGRSRWTAARTVRPTSRGRSQIVGVVSPTVT